MKKKLKVLLSLIVVFAFFLLTFNVPVVNATNSNFIEERVEILLNECGVNYCIDDYVPLYSSDETIIAYLYNILPQGYVIILSDGQIIEFSLEQNFDSTFETEKIYYTGPLSYLVKQNGRFIDVKTSNAVSTKNIADAEDEFFTKVKQVSTDTLFSSSSDSVTPRAEIIDSDYKTTYTPAAYDNDGTHSCGPIAVAILLKYYDDHINGNFLTSTYNTADGSRLINYLQPIIDADAQGCTASDMANGINYHLSTRNISSYNASAQASISFSFYKTKIRRNRPAVISVAGHAVYQNHAVVGYGYFISNPATYIIVSDGWGSTGIRINFNYVADMVYLAQ